MFPLGFMRSNSVNTSFVFLQKEVYSKRERIFSSWEQILSFQNQLFYRRYLVCRKANGITKVGALVQNLEYVPCRPRWLSWMRVRLVVRRLRVRPLPVGNILSWRFDHEIFSTVNLSLPLIQEGQLSVAGERIYTILVNHLEE